MSDMLSRLRRRIAAIVARPRFEEDMSDEIRSHIEHRTDDLVASGMPRDDAARQARMEFGALEAYKEQCRDSRGFVPARITLGVWGDVKLAARRLRATPIFVAFAVMSLAAGIGVTTTSYALIESMFWRPLGIPDSDRVAALTVPPLGSSGEHLARISRHDFEEIRGGVRSLTSIAASARFSETLVTGGGSEPVSGEAVTGAYFTLLGIDAAVGRTLQPGDDQRATPALVLSHTLWRTHFGADPSVVGRVVRLGGQPFEIVGVAPRTFSGIRRYTAAGAWVPLSAASIFPGLAAIPGGGDVRNLSVVGRLSQGRTMAAAAADVRSIATRLNEMSAMQGAPLPGGPAAPAARSWTVQDVEHAELTPAELPYLLLVIVSMVLLVACTNLASLMLARGTTRQHEFAVRRALGASRWRLVREQCTESVIVALLGGIAATAFTRWLIVVVPGLLPGLRSSNVPVEPVLTTSVLLVTAGALLVSLVTFGLEPAIQLTRRPVRADLAAESGGVGVPTGRRQRTLIRWQVAICTCFFLITTILGRVAVDEARHDSGVDLDRLAVATIDGWTGWDEGRIRQMAAAAIAAARQEPGIEAVAVSAGLPFGTRTAYAALTTLDKPFVEGRSYAMDESRGAILIPATSDIFRTLGIRLVSGRAFSDADDAVSPPVAVVSVKTAREMFGTREVIGRQLMVKEGRRPATTVTIVGLVEDTDAGMMMFRSSGHVYVPFSQHFVPLLNISARTTGDPALAARSLQTAIRRADPDLSAASYGPGRLMLAGRYVIARTAAMASAALGALTLLLAMVGLYGVQAHAVAHRTREVGVRVALGATARQIERMVLSEGFRPVIQGLVLGLLLGSLARLALRTLVEAPIALFDPLALLVVPIPLALAAFLACHLPAYRAARVDPCVALRHL